MFSFGELFNDGGVVIPGMEDNPPPVSNDQSNDQSTQQLNIQPGSVQPNNQPTNNNLADGNGSTTRRPLRERPGIFSRILNDDCDVDNEDDDGANSYGGHGGIGRRRNRQDQDDCFSEPEGDESSNSDYDDPTDNDNRTSRAELLAYDEYEDDMSIVEQLGKRRRIETPNITSSPSFGPASTSTPLPASVSASISASGSASGSASASASLSASVPAVDIIRLPGVGCNRLSKARIEAEVFPADIDPDVWKDQNACGCCLLELIENEDDVTLASLRDEVTVTDMSKPSPFHNEEIGCISSCFHVFHASCIYRWSMRENSCPQCKQRFGALAYYRRNGHLQRWLKINKKMQSDAREEPEVVPNQPRCILCNLVGDPESLIHCRRCDKPCHFYCLQDDRTDSTSGLPWTCSDCDSGTRGSAAARDRIAVSNGDAELTRERRRGAQGTNTRRGRSRATAARSDARQTAARRRAADAPSEAQLRARREFADIVRTRQLLTASTHSVDQFLADVAPEDLEPAESVQLRPSARPVKEEPRARAAFDLASLTTAAEDEIARAESIAARLKRPISTSTTSANRPQSSHPSSSTSAIPQEIFFSSALPELPEAPPLRRSQKAQLTPPPPNSSASSSQALLSFLVQMDAHLLSQNPVLEQAMGTNQATAHPTRGPQSQDPLPLPIVLNKSQVKQSLPLEHSLLMQTTSRIQAPRGGNNMFHPAASSASSSTTTMLPRPQQVVRSVANTSSAPSVRHVATKTVRCDRTLISETENLLETGFPTVMSDLRYECRLLNAEKRLQVKSEAMSWLAGKIAAPQDVSLGARLTSQEQKAFWGTRRNALRRRIAETSFVEDSVARKAFFRRLVEQFSCKA